MLFHYIFRRMPVFAICIIASQLFSVQHLLAENNSDTIRISLPEAEKIFLQKNLSLLAAKYNIDINKALTEQAKLWDNPILVTDQNIYADHAFFAHGKDASGQLQGQYFIQVQQLIKTAGKRSKWIAMAETNTRLSNLQFNEVLRNLKYQLRTDYYSIVRMMAVQKLYQNELKELSHLVTGMEAQLVAGNIAPKDLVRIKALLYSMQQDLTDNERQLSDVETDLKSLLQMDNGVFLAPSAVLETQINTDTLHFENILSEARLHNTAYAIQQMQLVYQQQSLGYQKALRSPDITIAPEYDHNSNYAPHYAGLTVSLPLNLFNKNQGNIKAADYAVKQQETVVSQAETELNNNLRNAMNKLLITARLSGRQEQDFYRNYETLFKNITDSYRQRQISLVEFIDFFDAYRDSNLQWLQQELNLRLAREELNYQTGTDIIK